MRIHLIRKETIKDFAWHNAGSRIPLEEWLTRVKYADWQTPADMLNTFRSVDLLGKESNQVVFDIGGNNYRMICKYAFGRNQVHLFVCWTGSHKAYDELCKGYKQYFINAF